MDRVQNVVVGAGVVGLAVARQLAKQGREVFVIEAASMVGTGTSSRNSEVIHAGIYYPRASLKAKMCVRGRDQLYRFCQERSVPHRRCGKLIVATTAAQAQTLAELKGKAEANGVFDLTLVTREQVRDMEPQVSCVSGLLSPSTGIIDSHALMLAIQADAEADGAVVVLNEEVLGGWVEPSRVVLECSSVSLECARVINCAGLRAGWLARQLLSDPRSTVGDIDSLPLVRFAKGNYFRPEPGTCRNSEQRISLQRLVYPIPEPGGLGTHATIDLAGRIRFGPDVEWVEDPTDLRVSSDRANKFYAAIRNYLPDFNANLVPDYWSERTVIF
eukprot:c20449_g1_i1.p1 GENE.c20449_g1_i1~~c20449_g1_i1.p1  ORF type:complete len:330 (+),score=63.15 c20449_g1_i1:22-1011(+)